MARPTWTNDSSLSNQELIFDRITWLAGDAEIKPLLNRFSRTKSEHPQVIQGSGMHSDTNPNVPFPYWIFDLTVDSTKGLKQRLV